MGHFESNSIWSLEIFGFHFGTERPSKKMWAALSWTCRLIMQLLPFCWFPLCVSLGIRMCSSVTQMPWSSKFHWWVQLRELSDSKATQPPLSTAPKHLVTCRYRRWLAAMLTGAFCQTTVVSTGHGCRITISYHFFRGAHWTHNFWFPISICSCWESDKFPKAPILMVDRNLDNVLAITITIILTLVWNNLIFDCVSQVLMLRASNLRHTILGSMGFPIRQPAGDGGCWPLSMLAVWLSARTAPKKCQLMW